MWHGEFMWHHVGVWLYGSVAGLAVLAVAVEIFVHVKYRKR